MAETPQRTPGTSVRSAPRLNEREVQAYAERFRSDGFVRLDAHFDRAILAEWQRAFAPLLERHLATEESAQNRGSNRYYVTFPFRAPFADPRIYADPDVLRICRLLVGDDMWMCQLASDTPLLGSTFQDVHRDALPLFPELDAETPSYQLAINFPLVDVDRANGPTEIARGTHQRPKEVGLAQLERGETILEPIEMKVGDVLIRDVRGLHRGTPNTTAVPRPMVVIGYSRRWLFRPEVSIRVGRSDWDALEESQRYLLRFNPVVSDAEAAIESETYRTFAF
jgi:hypothetical protein